MGLKPLSVSFKVETECGDINGWTWGDGNSSSQSLPNGTVDSDGIYYYWWNFTHSYRYVGAFVAQVSINAEGPNGPYVATDSLTIYVDSVGPVSFSANPNFGGSPPVRVSFSYETFWGGSDEATWTFGDGNISVQSSPNGTAIKGTVTYQWWNYTHTYTYAQDFEPVVNVSGGSHYATESTSVYISWAQEVSFTSSTNFGDPPLSVSFSYETKYASGDSVSWTWGDGNISSASSPNASKIGASFSYQWWNYSHIYHYLGAYIPEVVVRKSLHSSSALLNVYASFVPTLFYSFYNESGLLASGDNGSKYSIGLVEGCTVEDTGTNISALQADLDTFDTRFDLPSATLEGPVISGGSVCPSSGAYGATVVETSLDIEWAHVAAPQAKIWVCLATNFSYPDLNGCVEKFYQNSSASEMNTMIVSNSWGYCAQELTTYTAPCQNSTYPGGASIWSPAESAGMNLISSSGDNNVGACDTGNYPAANPFDIAVGATTVNSVGLDGAYGSESKWSTTSTDRTCESTTHHVGTVTYGTTAGSSNYYEAPSWQNESWYGQANRSFPDVSMVGNITTGVPIVTSYIDGGGQVENGEWELVGGTSVGAPIWAGVLDMLFQANGSLLSGFVGPFLYSSTASGCYHIHIADSGTGLGSPNVGCLATAAGKYS